MRLIVGTCRSAGTRGRPRAGRRSTETYLVEHGDLTVSDRLKLAASMSTSPTGPATQLPSWTDRGELVPGELEELSAWDLRPRSGW